MVNVAGRSKGCSTCRRRRVKCDETRPTCTRCQRCGFECDGAKDITFVEAKIVNSRRSVKRAAMPRRCNSGDTDSPDRPMPLSASLRSNAFEMYMCYTRKYLRPGGPLDLALQDIQSGEIVTSGTTITAYAPIFQQAIISFATVLFGTHHRHTYITNQGYAMHGIALKQLNQALSDPRCYASDEVILSVAALAMLEGLVPTGPKLYLKHMIGLERLLGLRDPRAYCSPKSAELYKAIRHMLLFASLLTRRASILARAEWKAVLRANCSDEEMQEQDLYDVLADCTVLNAEYDNMLANGGPDLERCRYQRDRIKRRLLALLADLAAWRKRWDSDEKNSYFETSPALVRLRSLQERGGDDLPPFLTVFEFSNEPSATMLMFYNTTLTYILRILASLEDIRSDQSWIQNTLQYTAYPGDLWKHTRDEYNAAERLAAMEVCRCVPYLVRKSRFEQHRSPVIHWAVSTAWMTLGGNESAEGRWMMHLLNGESGGVIAKALFAT